MIAAGLVLTAALALSTPSGGPERLVTVQDTRITESSGLAVSPTHAGLVWTVNDSGGSASVYGVSLRTGKTVAVLRLADTQARDWEAMAATRDAAGRGLLWIADVGDNSAVRESVVLRLVREPTTVASATLTPVSLRVRYPGGPRDVETLIAVPDGRLLLVSKGLFSCVVYQVPPAAVAAAIAGRSTSTPVEAIAVATVPQSFVTDGAAAPDGRIVLRGYSGATVYANPQRGSPVEVIGQVSLPRQPQGETLTVVDGGAAAVVGSEGVREPLWRVPLPALSSAAPGTAPPGTAVPSTAPPGTAAPATAAPSRPADNDDGPRWPLILGVALVGIAGIAVVAAARRR